MSAGALAEAEKSTITGLFNDLHQRLRGHSAQAEPLEIVSYRLRAEVPVPQYRPQPAVTPACARPAAEACVGARAVSFGRGQAAQSTQIWRREHLVYGNVVHGPSIVEQIDATTVVPPGWAGRIDAYGNLLMERGSQS
jgi:N-methylhydantoinase A